jgi:hypothetical protein
MLESQLAHVKKLWEQISSLSLSPSHPLPLLLLPLPELIANEYIQVPDPWNVAVTILTLLQMNKYIR